MKQTKQCKLCQKEFITYHNCQFCSYVCYWNYRFPTSGKCKTCGKISKLRYCSKKCIRDYWNKNDYHLRRKRKIWEKKISLLKELGGKCKKCGIVDMRVLDINHINKSEKVRPPKLQYTWQRRFKEWKENKSNLELLCANCHRIHTWEQMGYGKF